jgi:hypothetical protein
VTEAEKFALDFLVAPAGIVSGHLLDQGDDGRVDRRPIRPAGICPVAGDQPPMPTHDRGWSDERVRRQRPGQESDQGGEHRPVGPVQSRRRILPAQDRVLLAENQDLRIFGNAGAGQESKPAGDAAQHEVDQA